MSTRSARFAAGACLVVLSAVGCGRSSEGSAPSPVTSTGSAIASAAPSAAPSAPPAPTRDTWSGKYVSAPGSLYVYDGGEWKGVHFRGDDASVGLGEGPLSLTVDLARNVVRGTGSGPLGDVVLTGAVTNGELTFTVLRKDTADRGLTGTGSGKISGDALTGTMRLSRGDAHVIREATFKLARTRE